jgi:hypothetical protein
MANYSAIPEDVKFRKLKNFNGIMGFFHLVQAIIMLALSNNFSLPITNSYLKFDPIALKLGLVTDTLFNLRIGPMVALFLLFSAVAHIILAYVANPWYVKNLKNGINYARWYEYAFSSSVMIIIIAMLVGVYDIGTLLMMFALNASMNFFGLMMEVHNQNKQKTNWTAYIFGCIDGIFPWIVIAVFFAGSAAAAKGAIPDFVTWIYVSIFVFFNLFAINMALQYKKVGPWKDYLYGERMYVILSLVAKSALAWQVFAGTLRPV